MENKAHGRDALERCSRGEGPRRSSGFSLHDPVPVRAYSHVCIRVAGSVFACALHRLAGFGVVFMLRQKI